MHGRNPNWHAEIRRCGYKMTPARECVIDFFYAHPDGHYSIEEIYKDIVRDQPGVGLTTVYRTIDLLVNIGVLVKFDFGDGRARYEISEGELHKTHHHHLVCTRCGRIIDYSDFAQDEMDFLRKVEKGLSKKYDFDIKAHTIQFYGLCQDCRK